jgi:hypothetical protein
MNDDRKDPKTLLGMPMSPEPMRKEVPHQSGKTILGIPAPAVGAAPVIANEPSVRVEVLHIEDRLSLDDRWSLESPPGQPAPEPPVAATPAPVPAAFEDDDSGIAPAGVPRKSSFGKTLLFLLLVGAAAGGAYVERARIAKFAAPYIEP